MTSGGAHRPIHDLRLVLWSYDRVNEARKREASLNDDLLVSLMGHTVIWWSLLCGRLDAKGGAHVQALMELASWMEEKGWRNDPRNAFRKIPEESFPGTEENVPLPLISTSATFPEGRSPRSRRPRRVIGH
jgi:hypothetical protein